MNHFVAEIVGTALLLLLGNGVVANVLLSETKGHGAGWLVICAGWGFAVFTAVLCVAEYSGAHLNPAVTIGLAAAGMFEWSLVGSYLLAQMIGAVIGATLTFVFYLPHYRVTEDADLKLATFCTGPAIRSLPSNLFCEAIGTFVLVYAALMAVEPGFELIGENGSQTVTVGLGAVGALPIGLVVMVIGLTLGGTTGYAINPARDLGPRIAHFLLPVPGKRDSDWGYAAIPVLGPILGGFLAAGLFRVTHGG